MDRDFPLAEGEKLLEDFKASLSQEQSAYICASVAERKRRKVLQERIRYAVMAAISVLAIVAGIQWFQAERQRQSAAQALKSEAQVTAKAPGTVAAGELGKLQPSRASIPAGRVARRNSSIGARDQV